MPDVTLLYKDQTILELDESATRYIKLSGKYCEDDISLTYVKSGGGGRCPRAEKNGLFYFDPFMIMNPMGGIVTVESPTE